MCVLGAHYYLKDNSLRLRTVGLLVGFVFLIVFGVVWYSYHSLNQNSIPVPRATISDHSNPWSDPHANSDALSQQSFRSTQAEKMHPKEDVEGWKDVSPTPKKQRYKPRQVPVSGWNDAP